MPTSELVGRATKAPASGGPGTDGARTGIWEDFLTLLSRDPQATAVLDDRGNRMTRWELEALSADMADEMQARGLVSGDVVIICMPNWTEWLAVYLAALRTGLVPGTLPVTSDPGSIAYVSNLVGARAVFLPSSHRGRSFRDEIGQLAETVGRRLEVMFAVGDQSGRHWQTIEGPEPVLPDYPAAMAHILFSSSTTGRSKAIAHSESSLRAYNQAVIDRYGVTGEQSIFMPSPLGHSTGFWHGARMSIMVGAPLVLQERWEPQRALELVSDNNCAITVAATPFLTDLVEAEWHAETPKLRGMRAFLCGGAPIPPSLIEKAQLQMPDTHICSIWAMSEGGATSSLLEDSVDRVANTCGRTMAGTELAVLKQDVIASRGSEGEIVMKTPSLFLGYINQTEMYEKSFTPEGYFRTGDVGIVDDDGYLRITGRLKDIIIRGGVNISPVEIECALASHDSIARIAVLGQPDDRMGERICAVIQPAGTPPSFEELLVWLEERNVPRRLWPESIRIVESMPATPAGKIRKNVLRQDLFGLS
ncbi:AMP-binding protein [Arthrobacter ginsengisoli]|uniref:AMP-binding protein n=1 Tax=Arthrobacter ginsengisoli TaxID=1356565 RepID=UPI00286A5DEF|nr:AMP-binding protein [Arthrobacter ginsengisoli]